jgi:hypothetical protein
MQSVAVSRASRELRCPEEQIAVYPRSELANNVYDVEACGKIARYVVLRREPNGCVREPDPNPADLAAFKAGAHPAP